MAYKQTIIDGKTYFLVPTEIFGRPKKLDTDNEMFLKTLLLQKSYMKRKELAQLYDVSEPTITRALQKARAMQKKEGI